MSDKETSKSNKNDDTPAEGSPENTISDCTKKNDMTQNAAVESDTLVIATYVDNDEGDSAGSGGVVDISSAAQNEPSDIDQLLSIVRLCDGPSTSTQEPSDELHKTKTSTCVSNVITNIAPPSVQSVTATAPTIKETTNSSALTVAIDCDELPYTTSTSSNSKTQSSQQSPKPTISVKCFSPMLRVQTMQNETLSSPNVCVVTERRKENSESDNVAGPQMQSSNDDNPICLPAVADLDGGTRAAMPEVTIEELTSASESRAPSPANSSVTSVSTLRASRSAIGRRVVCLRHIRRAPKEPEEYMDALFPHIREAHNQIRKTLLHAPLTDVKDNALLKRKMFEVIRHYISGCKNEFERVTASLILCRRLKRNIIRLLDLFHDICSSSREDPAYLYHISQLIAVYNSLEIKLSSNLTRLQKCALIHRIAHIINKHLLVKDESLAKENVLRMFLHMPDMYSARFIMEPLFNTFLAEIPTSNNARCQRELSDKKFVQYIIVLHLWKEMLRNPLEQVELINRAQHFMCPTKTLHTNPMYVNHLPTIHTRKHAVKDILNSLKYFHDLKNAAICDDTLEDGDGDIEVVIDDVINATPLWDFGATYAAELKHRKRLNRRAVTQEPLECVDLTLEDEQPSRMTYVEHSLDWLTDLKERASERVQADETEMVICLDSDSDGELFSGSILDPTESYQDCDAVDTDYTSLDSSTTDDKAASEDDALAASGITPNGLRTYLAPKSKKQFNSSDEKHTTSRQSPYVKTTNDYGEDESESEGAGEGGNVTASRKPSTSAAASLPLIVNTFTVNGKQNMHLLNSPRFSLDIGPERFGNEDMEFHDTCEGKVIYSQALSPSNRRLLMEDNVSGPRDMRREFEAQDNPRVSECGSKQLRLNADDKPVKKQVKFNDNPIGPTRRLNTKLPIKPAIHLGKTQTTIQQPAFPNSPQPRFTSPSSSTSSTTESLKQMAQKGRRIVDSFKVQKSKILPENTSPIIIDSDDDNDTIEVSACASTTKSNLTVSTQPIQSKKPHEKEISNQYLSVLKSNICNNPKCKMKARYVSHRSKSIHGPKDISSTNYVCNRNIEFIHISDDSDDDNDSIVCNNMKSFEVGKQVEMEEQNSNVSTTTGPSLESNAADEHKAAAVTEMSNRKQMLVMVESTSSQIYRATSLENNVGNDICTSSTETLLQETELEYSVSSPNIVDSQFDLAKETDLHQMSSASELDCVAVKGDVADPFLTAKKNDKTELGQAETNVKKYTGGEAKENECNELVGVVWDRNILNKRKSALASDFKVSVNIKQTLSEEVKINANVVENCINTNACKVHTSEGGVEQLNELDCETLVSICSEQHPADMQVEKSNADTQERRLTETEELIVKNVKVVSQKLTNQLSEGTGENSVIERIEDDSARMNVEQRSSTPGLEDPSELLLESKLAHSEQPSIREEEEKSYSNSISSATHQGEAEKNEELELTKSQVGSSTSASTPHQGEAIETEERVKSSVELSTPALHQTEAKENEKSSKSSSHSIISATPSHIQAASDKIEVQTNKEPKKGVENTDIITEIIKKPGSIHDLSTVITEDIAPIFESVKNAEETALVGLDVCTSEIDSKKKHITQANQNIRVGQKTNDMTATKTSDADANVSYETLSKSTEHVNTKQLPFSDKTLNLEGCSTKAQIKLTEAEKDVDEIEIESSANRETCEDLENSSTEKSSTAVVADINEGTPGDQKTTYQALFIENVANSTETVQVESVTLDEEVTKITNCTTSTEEISEQNSKRAEMEDNAMIDTIAVNLGSVIEIVKPNLYANQTANNSMASNAVSSENTIIADNKEIELSVIPMVSEKGPKSDVHREAIPSSAVKGSNDGLVRLVAAVKAVESLNLISNEGVAIVDSNDFNASQGSVANTTLISCENSPTVVDSSLHELVVVATTENPAETESASFDKSEKASVGNAASIIVNSVEGDATPQVSIIVSQTESITTQTESKLTGILLCGDKSPKTNLERLAEAVLLTEAAAQKYSGIVTKPGLIQTENEYNQSNAEVCTAENFEIPKHTTHDGERCIEENGLPTDCSTIENICGVESAVNSCEIKRITNDDISNVQQKSIMVTKSKRAVGAISQKDISDKTIILGLSASHDSSNVVVDIPESLQAVAPLKIPPVAFAEQLASDDNESLDHVTHIDYDMHVIKAFNDFKPIKGLVTKTAPNDAGILSIEEISKTSAVAVTEEILIKQEPTAKPQNQTVDFDTITSQNIGIVPSKTAPENPPLSHKTNPTFHSSFENFISSLKAQSELKLPRKSPRITSKTAKATEEASNLPAKSKKIILLTMPPTSERLTAKNLAPTTPQTAELSATSDIELGSIDTNECASKKRYSLRRSEQWKVVKNTSVPVSPPSKTTNSVDTKKPITRALSKRCIKIRLARAKAPTKAEKKALHPMADKAVQSIEAQFGDVSHRPITRKLAAALNSSLQMETENAVIEPIKPFPSRGRKSKPKQETLDDQSPTKRKRCEIVTKSLSNKRVIESVITETELLKTDTPVETQRKRKDCDVEATLEKEAPKSDGMQEITNDSVPAELEGYQKRGEAGTIFDDTGRIPEKNPAKRMKVENVKGTPCTSKVLAVQETAQVPTTFETIFIKTNVCPVDVNVATTIADSSNEEVSQHNLDKSLVQTSERLSDEGTIRQESQENKNEEPTSDENMKTSARTVTNSITDLEAQDVDVAKTGIECSANKSLVETESQVEQDFTQRAVDNSNEKVIATPSKGVLLAKSVESAPINCREHSNLLTENNDVAQLVDISSFRSLSLEQLTDATKCYSKSVCDGFQSISEFPNQDSTVDLSISNMSQMHAKDEDLNNTECINILKANMEADNLLEEYNHSARIIANANLKIPLAAQTPSDGRTPACSSVTFSYPGSDTSSSSTSSCSCNMTSTPTAAADLCKNEPTSFKVVQSQAQVVELLSSTSASFQDLSLLDLEHDVIISNDDLLSELMPTAIMDTMAATSLEHNYATKPLEMVMRNEYDTQYDLQIKSESPILQGEEANNWRDVEVLDINNAKDLYDRQGDKAQTENGLEDKRVVVDGNNEKPLQTPSLRVSIPIAYIKKLEELIGKQKESKTWYLSEKPSTSKAALEALARRNALANSKALSAISYVQADTATIDSSAPRQLLSRECCCPSPSLPLKKRRNVSGVLEEDLFHTAALLSEEDNLVQVTSESIISVTENKASELDEKIDISELDICTNKKLNKSRGEKLVPDDLNTKSKQSPTAKEENSVEIQDNQREKERTVLQDYQRDDNREQVTQSKQAKYSETENTDDKENTQTISSQDEKIPPTKHSNIIEGDETKVEGENKRNREGDEGESACCRVEEESKSKQACMQYAQSENEDLQQACTEKKAIEDLVQDHQETVGFEPQHKDKAKECQIKDIQQECADHSGVHSNQKESVGNNATELQQPTFEDCILPENLISEPNLAPSKVKTTDISVAGHEENDILTGVHNANLVKIFTQNESAEANESTNQERSEETKMYISYGAIEQIDPGLTMNEENYSEIDAKNFAAECTDVAKEISAMELKSSTLLDLAGMEQTTAKETRLTNYKNDASEVVLTSYDDQFLVTVCLNDSSNAANDFEEVNSSVFSTKEYGENDFDIGNDVIISTQEIKEESTEIMSIKSSPKSSPMYLAKQVPTFTTDANFNTDFSKANELIDFMPIFTNTATSTHSDDLQLLTIGSNPNFLNSNITSIPPTTDQMELFTSSAGITSTTPHTGITTTALSFNNMPIFTAAELGIDQSASTRSNMADLTQINGLGFVVPETMQTPPLTSSAIEMDSPFAQSQSQFMVADNWKASTCDAINPSSTLKISSNTSKGAKQVQTFDVKSAGDVSSDLATTTPAIKICSTKRSKSSAKNGGRKPAVKTNTPSTIPTTATEMQQLTQLSSLSPILPLIKSTTTTIGHTTNADTAPVFSFPDISTETVNVSHAAITPSRPSVTYQLTTPTASSMTVSSTTSSLSAQTTAEENLTIPPAQKSKSQSQSQSVARSGTRARTPARVQVVTPQPKKHSVAPKSVEEEKTLEPIFTNTTAAFCTTDFGINQMAAVLPASYPTVPMRNVTCYANLFHFEKYIQQLMGLIDVPSIIESARNLFVDKQALAEAHAALLAQATQFDEEGNAISQPLLLKYHKDGTISILNDNDECIILTANMSKMVKRLSLALSILQEQQSPVLGIRARIHALLKQLTQTATTKAATHTSTASVIGPSAIPTAVVNPTNLVENARNIEFSVLNAMELYSGAGGGGAKQTAQQQVHLNDTNVQIYPNWHEVGASDGQLTSIDTTDLQIANEEQFINIDPLPLLADEGTTGYEHAVAFDFDENPTILSSSETISAQRFENAFDEAMVGGVDEEKSYNWAESEQSRPVQQWQQQQQQQQQQNNRGNVERRWQEHGATSRNFAYEDAVVRGVECVATNSADEVHAMVINNLGAKSTIVSSSAPRIESVSVADSMVQSTAASSGIITSTCGPQRRETIKKTGFQKIEADQARPTVHCSKKVSSRKIEKASKIQPNLSSTAVQKQSKMRNNSKQSNAAAQLKISAIHYRYVPPQTIANSPCKQSATLHYRPTAPQQHSQQQQQQLRNANVKMAPQFVTSTSNHSKQPERLKTIDSVTNIQLYSQQHPQNSALAGGLQHSNNVRFLLANPLQQPNTHQSQRFVSVPNTLAPLTSNNNPTQEFSPLQEVHIQYPYQLQQTQPNFIENEIQITELQLHSIKDMPHVDADHGGSHSTDMPKTNAATMTTALPQPSDATMLRMVRTSRGVGATSGNADLKRNLTQNFQTQTSAFTHDAVETCRALPDAAQSAASSLAQLPQHQPSQFHQQQVQLMHSTNTNRMINDMQQTEMDQLSQQLIKQETQRQTELQFQIIQQPPQALLRGADENQRMHTMMTTPNTLMLYQTPARQVDAHATQPQQYPPQQQQQLEQHFTQQQLIAVSKQSAQPHSSQNAAGSTTSSAISNATMARAVTPATASAPAPTKQTNLTRKRGRPRKYDDEMLLANSELLRKRSARDTAEKFAKPNQSIKIIPIAAANSNAAITTTNQINTQASQLITTIPTTTYYTLTHNPHELEQQQAHQPNSISLSALATHSPMHAQLEQQSLRPSFTSQSSANAFSLIENMIIGVEAAVACGSGSGNDQQRNGNQQSQSPHTQPHMPPSPSSSRHDQHHV
ncbi:PREDICTED: uncharacterized protein LOC108359884 isoform X2 [Rhagoletis zephyria]|uniref:uncharacterized protein LOC108359884 isoform X2 n=2 Tax=Rhagoletis zephyria TaxID=28612 RepID=UPI0008114F39|nr:PREDICTED: uncharacterized protein LOC108359884 isoform X2 [Rhagoletis zephyria]